MRKRTSTLFLLLYLAGGCDAEPNVTEVGGVSADDARTLDDAAEKLDNEGDMTNTQHSD
jgi:hypothetical protein